MNYYTLSDIRKLGFTDLVIEKLNITPNDTKPNPRNRKNPIKLFSKGIIDTLVVSPEFIELFNKSTNRRLGAIKSKDTKTEKLLNGVKNLKVYVRIVKDVENLAINSYMERNREFVIYDFNEDFVKRITVNYIRHELTSYEDDLDFIFGKVGKTKAYKYINEIIYKSIKSAYPKYSDECDRQLKIKTEEMV